MLDNKHKKEIIVVIAAHPDDEILGAGATFAKLLRSGNEVHAIIVCEGESIRYESKKMQIKQQDDARQAAKIIGFSSFRCLMLPEQHLDTISQIDLNIKIEAILDELKPKTIYTHFHGDINRDHQLVHDSVMVAARPFREEIKKIFAFETPSSTALWNKYPFNPDTFEIVDETLEIKLEAMSCYKTEAPPFPHPRAIESLRHRAYYWGSLINRKAVEPFVTLRRIID